MDDPVGEGDRISGSERRGPGRGEGDHATEGEHITGRPGRGTFGLLG
jgi:hypothetical protein